MRTLILAVSLVFFFTVSPMARTWYVRHDGTGDAPTIQAAVDSAIAGDTVLVGPGAYSYALPVIIEERDSLTVRSEFGAMETAINGMYLNFVTTVSICGFTFTNSHYGLAIDWSHDIFVHSNIVRGTTSSGIISFISDGITVTNNRIYQCGGGGIAVFDAAGGIEIRNNTIMRCGYFGISTDAYPISIGNNIISLNPIGIKALNPAYIECNDVVDNGINYDLANAGDPTGISGNISIDPQFCSIAPELFGNFNLQSDSPCAPENHPDGYFCGLIGSDPVNCGPTAVAKTTWGGLKFIFK